MALPLGILKITSVRLQGDHRKSEDLTLYLCIQCAIPNMSCFCNSSSVTLDKLLNVYGPQILLWKMRELKMRWSWQISKLCENKHPAMYNRDLKNPIDSICLPYGTIACHTISLIWFQDQEIGKKFLKNTGFEQTRRKKGRKQLFIGEVSNSEHLLSKNN